MSRPVDLRCEYQTDPLGVGLERPRLSWRTETDALDWAQMMYEIEVVDSESGESLWHSGPVESAESVLVPWGGPNLGSRQSCRWRVRVWDTKGSVTEWSAYAQFEVGLLDSDDWTARFITPAKEDGGREATQPSPYLRRRFNATSAVVRARLYATALGVYELELNGERVGTEVLAPGWSSYAHRLRYQTYDVTKLVRNGENVLGVRLADGWARGNLIDTRAVWTDRLAVLAQLEIVYADGTVERIATDEKWTTATGAILAADLYNGETYDARREPLGWSSPTFDDAGWEAVEIFDRDLSTLCAPDGPPVRRIEEVAPVDIRTAPSGELIVDFGQNLVGWVRIEVKGAEVETVTLRHAEVLHEDELYVRPLRDAEATDRYTLRGDADGETWEPRFTFHGFRYVGVTAWPGTLTADSIVAVVVHSDMQRTGWFECSDPLINQLHENIVWGMRGNFVDVPTDCPQRSERLGWTGDIQVFGPTAVLLYDVAGVLASWLQDLAAQQTSDGVVPYVIPSVKPAMVSATCGWGDVATILPMTLYEHYGDRGVLERQLDSMRRWVDCEHHLAGDDLIWAGGWQFGDWLDPKAPPDDPAAARTDPELLATAYFAYSARLLSDAAAVLGRPEIANQYAALSDQVAAAFRDEYSTPRGRLTTEAQTAYAIALTFGLLEPTQVDGAIDRFVAMVKRDGVTIGTGFLGTPWVCPTLAEHGRDDMAYRLLTQQKCPSWLYPVTKGATTIWERWDAIQPDDTINPGEMLSFNHYAFGAIGAWLYHRVAGLRADAAHPGWRQFVVKPLPGGDLSFAQARVNTPLGLAEVSWSILESTFELEVKVPPNSRATVVLPCSGATHEVGSGLHRWTDEIDSATLERWKPSTAGPRTVTMAELASEPSVMEVIASVGVKIMTIGSYDEIGACTLEECIERAGLDESEADRLRAAVAAL